MAEKTGIAWTDHTFNPWIGCQQVSPGCLNCYAETLVTWRGWTQWGPGGERTRTSEKYWKQPFRWERRAETSDQRERVFCASLADVFDNQAPEGARKDLWELIRQTPHLDWQLLTKRPQNMEEMLPPDWGEGYPNVWLGISSENQEEYDRRWPLLAATPAALRFISYEPALGGLTLAGHEARPDWLIWGGESGRDCRPMDPMWARRITTECREAGVAVFGKQWGDYRHSPLVLERRMSVKDARKLDPHGKGGALLDGELIRQFPKTGRVTCTSGY